MGLQRKTGKGIKPRCGSHASGDHVALGCSLLPHGLGSKKDFAWRKIGERTLAGGP